MKQLAAFGLSCLAVFGVVSSAAVAQTTTCESGLINDEVINGDVIVNGTECYITDSVIRGDIIVADSHWFGITDSAVYGRVEINDSTGDGDVIIKDSFVFERSLVITGSDIAWVLDSQVVGTPDTSNMAFKNVKNEVTVLKSIVQGNLTCTDDTISIFEEGNFVGGKMTCISGVLPQ